MKKVFILELLLLACANVSTTTTKAVGGAFIAPIQHCGLGHLSIIERKSMNQGSPWGDMSMMEVVWVL